MKTTNPLHVVPTPKEHTSPYVLLLLTRIQWRLQVSSSTVMEG